MNGPIVRQLCVGRRTNKQTYPNYMDLLLINIFVVIVVVLVVYHSNGFKARVVRYIYLDFNCFN